MHSGRVLVVAPDEDLRHALIFALSAYGHAVTAEHHWRRDVNPENFDCTVLDEKALNGWPSHLAPERTILLAYTAEAVLGSVFASTIAMPLRGDAVVRAVAAFLPDRVAAK